MLNAAKYYAMVLTMAEHMPDGAEQRDLREQVLERMVEAVSVERVARGRCRDVDLEAATRIRPRW